MSTDKFTLTLRSVHFKGFKSIEDLYIDFEKGLNIFIGKNASGKSNFLEFLFQVMSRKLHKNSYRYAKLEFITHDNSTFTWISERIFQNIILNDSDEIFERIRMNEILLINQKIVFENTSKQNSKKNLDYGGKNIPLVGNVQLILRRLGFQVNPLYIKYNIPDNLEGISSSSSMKLYFADSVFDLGNGFDTLNFLNQLLFDVENYYSSDIEKMNSLDKDSFYNRLKIRADIKDNLKIYTPIQDIQFNKNINIYMDEKSITIENIKIDFKVNGNWIPWSQLSDGTKRLFYLIAEITNQEDGFVLVEEPELGIHPHQFNLIMEFLKEESKNKQIFISTHSPQALNHLNESELSHILITYYDTKKSTQIKHLTTSEIKKAKKYMKEVGFFSDYWMLSDLE